MHWLNLLSLNVKDDNTPINRLDCDGLSPLMLSVFSRNYPLVKTFLALGADPNQKSIYKQVAPNEEDSDYE